MNNSDYLKDKDIIWLKVTPGQTQSYAYIGEKLNTKVVLPSDIDEMHLLPFFMKFLHILMTDFSVTRKKLQITFGGFCCSFRSLSCSSSSEAELQGQMVHSYLNMTATFGRSRTAVCHPSHHKCSRLLGVCVLVMQIVVDVNKHEKKDLRSESINQF